jgi:hypothetical protein
MNYVTRILDRAQTVPALACVLDCGDGVREVTALVSASARLQRTRWPVFSNSPLKAATPKTPSPHSKSSRQDRTL